MIILVQNADTLAFAGSDGGWTHDRASAHELASGHEAVLFCVAHGLAQAQVLYEFPEPKLNFTLSLTPTDIAGTLERNSRRPVNNHGSLLPADSPRKPRRRVRSGGST